MVREELRCGIEGGTARPRPFDLLLHTVGVLCHKEEAQVDDRSENAKLEPSPPHLMHDTTVVKPNGVDGEGYEGKAVVQNHEPRKVSKLQYGASVEAQVTGPTVNLSLYRARGASRSCGVGGDGTLNCPPTIVDLVRVQVVENYTSNDHPCVDDLVGPIQDLGVVFVVHSLLFIRRYIVGEFYTFHLGILFIITNKN